MSLTYGAMFAGYGGLELGVQSVLGGRALWHAEFEKAPSAILAHHYPDVPNLGDVTKVDWASVPKVDVITGGSPCQDLSHAGKRAGMTEGTRSNLWVQMREAVAYLRPSLVVWENVRGALSAPADSDLEPCAGCVGGTDDGPVLRALGRVVGDLSELGYDSWWTSLRAADVGAPHGRFRIFLFATPADAVGGGWDGWAPDAIRGQVGRVAAPRGGEVPSDLTLLPTHAVNDMGAAYTPEAWDAWTAKMQAAHGNGNGHGKSLSIEALRLLPTPRTSDTNGPGVHGDGGMDLRTAAVLLPTPRATRGGSASETRDLTPRAQNGEERNQNIYHRPSDQPQNLKNALWHLLPTPRATDGTKGGPNQRGSSGDLMLPSAVQDWREYEPAIRRWEHVLGRQAPPPTEPGAKGQPRLSPKFVEFMMGLPAGWVTDVSGVSRNDQLKALGNGVVPQQCAAATRAFIHDATQEHVA